MRKILKTEIRNERCNAAALGLFNASVSSGVPQDSDRGYKTGMFITGSDGIERKIIGTVIDEYGDFNVILDDRRKIREPFLANLGKPYSVSRVHKAENKPVVKVPKLSDYSAFQVKLAKQYSSKALKQKLSEYENKMDKYTAAHHRAITATTSMTSNSQRRAHARNNVMSNAEWIKDYKNALEAKKHFKL